MADNPGAFPDGTVASLFIGRTFGWGGFPGTGGAQEGYREYETFSGSGSYAGTFANDVNYDFALSYSRTEGDRSTNDTFIEGLSAALNGFGICADPVTGAIPDGLYLMLSKLRYGTAPPPCRWYYCAGQDR